MDEGFWRNYINSIPMNSFAEESTEDQTNLQSKDVSVMRLRLDIYLLTPVDESGKAYMVTGNQKLEDLDIMTVKEALELIKKRNK